MKLAIMQPYFFPYIGYFQLINAVDKFILYDNVNYSKQGWFDRNRILTLNHHPVYFRVGINRKSSDKIGSLKIDNQSPWKERMLNQIFENYKKSPYFEEIFSLIKTAVHGNYEFLGNINSSTIRFISDYLDIPTQIVSDVSNYGPIEDQLRREDSDLNRFYFQDQQFHDKKSIRILAICKKEGAETYINLIGGQLFYRKDVFHMNGINLKFINSLPYSYLQNHHEFIPHLSIIDVLMNCGKDGTKELLNLYELL